MHLNIKPYLIILTSVILIFILFGLLRNFVFQKQLVEWVAVIYTVWIVFGLGIAIALPMMIKTGFFSNIE